MSEETKKKHEQIDPIFKQIIEDRFAPYKATCQTEFEVGRLPRKIDAFITIEDDIQKIRTETPFFYFLKNNQVEFKGRRDPLTKDDYHNIQGRKHFLLGRRNISAFDMTVTIISAGKPHSVLTYAQKRKRPFVPVETQKGYYKDDAYPPIYLIVANELPIIPENYPLLVFASSKGKFREFLGQVVAEGEATYIRYAYEVRPKLTREILTMAGISSTLTREDLEFMADDIGRELIAVMNPEDMLEGMDSEKQQRLLSLLSPEARLADMSIEELLKGMNPEKQKALLEFLLKTHSATSIDEKKTSGRSNN